MKLRVAGVAFAVVIAVTGITFAMQKVDEKSAAKEKVESDQWLPKSEIKYEPRYEAKIHLPATAFPDLVPISFDREDITGEKRMADLKAKCPQLLGERSILIDPADDTFRKVLKAQLYQGVLECQDELKLTLPVSGPDRNRVGSQILWLGHMQELVAGLYSEQPKELIAWYCEILVVAKVYERWTHARCQAGGIRPADLYAVSRTRLKIESELLKAKSKK